MKYLWLLIVPLLAGCFHATWNDPLPPEKDTPVIIASGTNIDIMWRCQLVELKEDKAQVECEFKNRQPRAVPEVCIKVDFYSEADGHLITESNPVCSGLLPATETSTGTADFSQEKRATLHECGGDLQYCVMLAGVRQ